MTPFRMKLCSVQGPIPVSHGLDSAMSASRQELEVGGELLDFAVMGTTHDHCVRQTPEERVCLDPLYGEKTICDKEGGKIVLRVSLCPAWQVFVGTYLPHRFILKLLDFPQVSVKGETEYLMATAEA